MAVIAVEGMRFKAFIGCYPAEHVIGSDIEVSVKVALDVTLAGSSDDITKTINYEGIYWLVNGVMQGKMNLLETAVKKIIDAISAEYTSVKKIRVRVAKLHPPIHGSVKKVWVEDGWERA